MADRSPNVKLAIHIAGVAATVSEIGWAKVLMTRKFGHRQRLAAIINDLELEPDPVVKPGIVCDRCMNCVQGCAPGTIPHIREGKTVKIQIEDTVYEWGDIDLGRCAMSYHGGDASMSPFIHKDFPGWNIDVREQEFSELAAYKFGRTLSTAARSPTREFPSGYIIEGHGQLQK
jgi:epoxyqueuosine reductase